MTFSKALKELIYKSDFFYTSQLLRYRGEPEPKTLVGGVASLLLIFSLIGFFANKIINTFDMMIIGSSLSAQNADDPSSYMFQTYPLSPFMFGVQIWHHDLNTGPRYFDIVMQNTYYNYGEPDAIKTNVIKMQKCTKDHWNGYPELKARYEQLNVNYWLCPPMNATYQIKGKYSSQWSKTLDIAVMKCTNTSDPIRPCAPQADIDQYFIDNDQKIYYTIYFINAIINADQPQYLGYYLQDSNYVIFSQTSGEEIQIMVEDFHIQTDLSLLPYNQIHNDQGYIVSNTAIKNGYYISNTQTIYSTFFFFKSSTTKNYSRSFQKLDEIFSYIGGLFGTLVICFFLINIYNAYQMEIALAGYLYKNQFQKQNKYKQYHFLHFLLHLFYMFLKIIRVKIDWPLAQKMYRCRQEMLKQMDVLYVIKRIMFLQKAMSIIFTESQINAIHLQQKISLQQAKKFRKKFKTRNMAYNSLIKILQKQEQNKSQNEKSNKQVNNNKNTQLNNKILSKSSILRNKIKQQYQNMSSQSDSESDQYQKQKRQNWMRDIIKLKTQQEYRDKKTKIIQKLDPTILQIFQDIVQERQLQHKIYNQDIYQFKQQINIQKERQKRIQNIDLSLDKSIKNQLQSQKHSNSEIALNQPQKVYINKKQQKLKHRRTTSKFYSSKNNYL